MSPDPLHTETAVTGERSDRERLLSANPGDLETAIWAAMRAHDMPAVVGLLKLLAVRDPRRAQSVLDVIELGLAIKKAEESA